MHGDGRAIHFFVEPTAHGEDGVADGFALESAHAHAVQEGVGGVFGLGGGVGGSAAHLVGAREHDFADEFLGGPTVRDEPRGEPIEQFGMGRCLA